MSAISSSGVDFAGLEMQIGRPGRRRRGDAALRVAGRGQAEFARGGAIEDPGAQAAVVDQRQLLAGDAFAVEGMRAQAALAQRIVDDADAVGEQFLAHLVLQEAGLARDRRAIDGAGEMRHQRAGDARIEHHRHLARRHLARIEPRDGALAGAAADFVRAFQIARMAHAGIIVVALHAGAFAGDRRHRHAVAGAEIGAAEAVARHQHHAADAGGGRRAARFADALDREPGRFGGARHLFELRRHSAACGRSDRDRESRARAGSHRRARHICLPARRAPSPPRARRAPAVPFADMSLVETTAWRLPTSTRRPRSSPSELSHSSTAPSRTSIDSDSARTATASAASAPAARAAFTSRSARSSEGGLVEQGIGGCEHFRFLK